MRAIRTHEILTSLVLRALVASAALYHDATELPSDEYDFVVIGGKYSFNAF